jgi:hypothetical protein
MVAEGSGRGDFVKHCMVQLIHSMGNNIALEEVISLRVDRIDMA